VFARFYGMNLDGKDMPDKRERNLVVRAANKATEGFNTAGEEERYTRYEAQMTIDQINRYGLSKGLRPVLKIRRKWVADSRSKRATPPARRLLAAVCDIAEACARVREIRASHRQLARMAGLHKDEVAPLLHSLYAAKQLFFLGFTPCHNGQPRGTSRFSLTCPRPAQMVDEREPPTWDALLVDWVWSSSLAKGSISQARLRWLTRREPNSAASLPYVYGSKSNEGISPPNTFYGLLDNPLRGSP
jgi:hypothetical protein